MLPPAVRGLRAAVVFLTRVPVGGFPYRPADWRWASAHFPAVGLLLGALLALVWRLGAGLGAPAQACLVLAASLLLTGAFHEDGLADTADALGGASEPTRVLEILKDSRIGTFGAVALIVSMGLRIALLAELNVRAPVALLATQCASRLPPVLLMVAMPYVSLDAVAKSKTLSRAGWPQALVAGGWVLAAMVALVVLGCLPLVSTLRLAVAGVLIAALCAWRFHARMRGITGDFLGATQQLSECAMLIALAP